MALATVTWKCNNNKNIIVRRLNAGMQSRVRNRLITNVTIITEATVTWRYCYMKNSNIRWVY